jgi:hypothetical protein
VLRVFVPVERTVIVLESTANGDLLADAIETEESSIVRPELLFATEIVPPVPVTVIVEGTGDDDEEPHWYDEPATTRSPLERSHDMVQLKFCG